MSGGDETLLQTLLTTGRANLSTRDASSDLDISIFAELKERLNRAPLHGKPSKATTEGERGINAYPGAAENAAVHRMIFPCDGEFHRRTGEVRRRRGRREAPTSGVKGEAKDGTGTQGQRWSDPRRGPDGLTASTAKVKWFCGALRKSAEKHSRGGRGRAEAFLLSVFEDFDRCGTGTQWERSMASLALPSCF